MKYKLIEGSTIFLGGVASYTTDNKPKDTKAKKVKLNFDFDFEKPKTFVFDFDKMKEEKEKFKQGIKKEAQKFKEANKTKTTDSNPEDSNEDTNYDHTFEFAEDIINGFGDVMNNLGKNFEQWGKSFEGSMEKFGVDLDKFGSEMDKFGSEIEKRVSNYAKDMENFWTNGVTSEEYDTWELESLFNEIYMNSEGLKDFDKSPKLYYKVNGYDLGTSMNDQLTFIGSNLQGDAPLPFGFVTKTLIADKWLVLKLSHEEYSNDWMQKLEAIDEIEDYEVEQYFITRAFRSQEAQDTKKIKIFVPLKNK